MNSLERTNTLKKKTAKHRPSIFYKTPIRSVKMLAPEDNVKWVEYNYIKRENE